MLVRRHSNAGVDHCERKHCLGAIEHLVVEIDSPFRCADPEHYPSLLGELEGVRQKVLQYLLDPFLVGVDVRKRLIDKLDREVQPLLLSHLPEHSLEIVTKIADRYPGDIDRHRSGFDLREVQDLVDQTQKVRSR